MRFARIPPRPGDKLHDAARSGNVAALEAALEADPAPVNEESDYGWTPLITALFYWQSAAVKILLDHGADPNLRSEDGKSTLFFFTNNCEFHQDSEDVLRWLLDAGADPNAPLFLDRDQRTPIEYARTKGSRMRAMAEVMAAHCDAKQRLT